MYVVTVTYIVQQYYCLKFLTAYLGEYIFGRYKKRWHLYNKTETTYTVVTGM